MRNKEISVFLLFRSVGEQNAFLIKLFMKIVELIEILIGTQNYKIYFSKVCAKFYLRTRRLRELIGIDSRSKIRVLQLLLSIGPSGLYRGKVCKRCNLIAKNTRMGLRIIADKRE